MDDTRAALVQSAKCLSWGGVSIGAESEGWLSGCRVALLRPLGALTPSGRTDTLQTRPATSAPLPLPLPDLSECSLCYWWKPPRPAGHSAHTLAPPAVVFTFTPPCS